MATKWRQNEGPNYDKMAIKTGDKMTKKNDENMATKWNEKWR